MFFQQVTGEHILPWEFSALVEMNEAFRKAVDEPPVLEPLTMELFDQVFPG